MGLMIMMTFKTITVPDVLSKEITDSITNLNTQLVATSKATASFPPLVSDLAPAGMRGLHGAIDESTGELNVLIAQMGKHKPDAAATTAITSKISELTQMLAGFIDQWNSWVQAVMDDNPLNAPNDPDVLKVRYLLRGNAPDEIDMNQSWNDMTSGQAAWGRLS
jgi:hypothetical protein